MCKFELSLDGILFIPCLEEIIVYDKDIKVSNVTPKCATLNGQIDLYLTMIIDEKIIKYTDKLIIGFK